MSVFLLRHGLGEAGLGSSRHLATGESRILVGGIYRLSNSAELATRLKLPTGVCDELILQAGWRQWGVELAEQLRGSFALVIRDVAANVIYAARDALGQEPMFLARAGGGWFFGDNPRDVRTAAALQVVLKPEKIADYLCERVVDRDRTFFEGLERLPCGHWTKISKQTRETRCYWSVADPPMLNAPEDAASTFRRLFDRSVALQASGSSPIGLLISGGLDSSSVLASLAARQPASDIVGLSRTYESLGDWSDAEHLALLAKAFEFRHFVVPSHEIDPLDHLTSIITAADGPVMAYGIAEHAPLYALAKANGCTVVLDGHGGDEVVSFGLGLLNELARQGDWLGLWRAALAPASIYGGDRLSWMRRYLIHQPGARMLRNLWRWRSRKRSRPVASSIISRELEAFVTEDRPQLRNPFSSASHSERDLHEFALGSPIQQYAQETLVVVGRSHGVDCRMPFLDRELAEFSLGLPAHAKLKDGLTRVILREAMIDRLPTQLLRRIDKFDFAPAFAASLCRDRKRLLELTDPDDLALAPFVNPRRLRAMHDQLRRSDEVLDTRSARTLFRVAQLSIWLRSL